MSLIQSDMLSNINHGIKDCHVLFNCAISKRILMHNKIASFYANYFHALIHWSWQNLHIFSIKITFIIRNTGNGHKIHSTE